MCVCVCVCVKDGPEERTCVCVCVCVCEGWAKGAYVSLSLSRSVTLAFFLCVKNGPKERTLSLSLSLSLSLYMYMMGLRSEHVLRHILSPEINSRTSGSQCICYDPSVFATY